MHLRIYVWMCASTCIGHIKIKGKLGKEMRLDEEKEYRKWKARENYLQNMAWFLYCSFMNLNIIYSSKESWLKRGSEKLPEIQEWGRFLEAKKSKGKFSSISSSRNRVYQPLDFTQWMLQMDFCLPELYNNKFIIFNWEILCRGNEKDTNVFISFCLSTFYFKGYKRPSVH